MARVDVPAWLRSQLAALRKTHNDLATSVTNLITGQTLSLSPGVWAPAGQGIQTPPTGAATWSQINAFTGSGWTARSSSAKPSVLLLPANLVLFVGTMNLSGTGSTANGNQILNALPSWAWPQNTGCRITLGTTGASGANNSPFLTISLSGIVACQSVPLGTTDAGWACVYPLDCPAAP
jgi:hypothetical protein